MRLADFGRALFDLTGDFICACFFAKDGIRDRLVRFCNIFTHLAFMPCNMSVCHLAVMFTCGATRANQEVYSDAFG